MMVVINKQIKMVERVYSLEIGCDFNTLMERIITNKIDEIVHNASKVNTATSQIDKKGLEIL